MGRFGVDVGSVWGRFGIGLGSIWEQFGVSLGSVRGRFGVGLSNFGGALGKFAEISSVKVLSVKVAPCMDINRNLIRKGVVRKGMPTYDVCIYVLTLGHPLKWEFDHLH